METGFNLVALALTADGTHTITIPYPPGTERSVTVAGDFRAVLPKVAREHARNALPALIKMVETYGLKNDRVVGVRISMIVGRNNRSPNGFKAWAADKANTDFTVEELQEAQAA